MIKLFNNDYKECENIKFNLIFTDIPYNIGKDAYASNPRWWKNGNIKDGISKKANQTFFELDQNFDLHAWLKWCNEHLVEDGKIITFCSIEQLSEIIMSYKTYFKKYTPLIFIKNNSAEALKVNMRIVGACEYGVILYKNKLGKFYNNNKMIKNWFYFDRLTKKLHPNQKPINLCKEILKLYVNSNDLVCDTCMGVGSIVQACKELNINCYGFEIDKKYYEIAKNLLSEK